jgi:anti-sigma regulatory factor (Ser/Thr protein kinase)
MVSELVSNAIRHGGGDAEGRVTLRVEATPTKMRVEVSDEGTGFDPRRLRPRPSHSVGGYGLEIIAALAHRWGVARDPTRVWFEIDRPQRDEPILPAPSPPEAH